MATLGEKLKANYAAANAAMTSAEARKRDQDRRLWDAEDKKVLAVIEEIKAKITNAIENDEPLKAVKLPKWEPFNVHGWPNKKMVGEFEVKTHPHFTAIQSFFEWADANGLVGKFSYEHDGVGIESWFVATVEPK